MGNNTSNQKNAEYIKNYASFPILNPNPIIEADFEGNLLFQNPAAKKCFPNLENQKLRHPLLANWKQTVKPLKEKTQTSFRKETFIGSNWFIAQYYLVPGKEKIRVYFTSIDELKQTELALEKERNLLQTLMNGSRQFHFVYLDKDFNFIYVNEAYAETCGYKPEEMIGKNHFDLYPNKEAEAIFRKVCDTGQPVEYKDSPCGPINQKKKLTYWNWKLQPIKNPQGKVESLVLSLVETTERKNFQTKLEEYASKMEALAEERARKLSQTERLATIGQTAGMVGHDIRNPLQAIAGELYLAKGEVDTLPDCPQKKSLRESIVSIEENLYYIDKIVADLQDYTKPLKPNKEQVQIEKAIEEALLIVNIPSRLNVNIAIEKGFPKLTADFPMLKRILINLIQNAVQAMPNNGTLKISAQTRNGTAQISVQDTGIGIPQEVQAKLFTPLFTTKSKGQGFGLVVVKRLVEAQNGEITYETEDGKGTTFTIQLPLK